MLHSLIDVQNAPQELFFLASDNLLSDPADAAEIKWRLLPDGDHGLLPPVIERA